MAETNAETRRQFLVYCRSLLDKLDKLLELDAKELAEPAVLIARCGMELLKLHELSPRLGFNAPPIAIAERTEESFTCIFTYPPDQAAHGDLEATDCTRTESRHNFDRSHPTGDGASLMGHVRLLRAQIVRYLEPAGTASQ